MGPSALSPRDHGQGGEGALQDRHEPAIGGDGHGTGAGGRFRQQPAGQHLVADAMFAPQQHAARGLLSIPEGQGGGAVGRDIAQ